MSADQSGQISISRPRTAGRRRPGAVLEVADRRIAMLYRPHPKKLLAAVIFFTFAALFLGYLAHVNQHGLMLAGMIHLKLAQATQFYYVISIVSIGLVLCGLAYILPQLFIRRRIVLDSATITLPMAGFTPEHKTLTAADITGATIHKRWGKPVSIQVQATQGTFAIHSACLAAGEDFFAVLVWIKTHVKSVA